MVAGIVKCVVVLDIDQGVFHQAGLFRGIARINVMLGGDAGLDRLFKFLRLFRSGTLQNLNRD